MIPQPEFSDKELEEGVRRVRELMAEKKTKKTPNTTFIPSGVGFADTILWREFTAIKPKKGLFGFVNGESCAACEEYERRLKNLGSLKSEMTLVLMMKPHQEEALAKDGVTVPFTRIYDGGEDPIWEVQGILYSTQLESLFRAYKAVMENREFHSIDEFEVFSATAKPNEVQCFEAKEFLNMEISGRRVIARQGQFVVFWPETRSFEVLNPDEFADRFEAK